MLRRASSVGCPDSSVSSADRWLAASTEDAPNDPSGTENAGFPRLSTAFNSLQQPSTASNGLLRPLQRPSPAFTGLLRPSTTCYGLQQISTRFLGLPRPSTASSGLRRLRISTAFSGLQRHPTAFNSIPRPSTVFNGLQWFARACQGRAARLPRAPAPSCNRVRAAMTAQMLTCIASQKLNTPTPHEMLSFSDSYPMTHLGPGVRFYTY